MTDAYLTLKCLACGSENLTRKDDLVKCLKCNFEMSYTYLETEALNAYMSNLAKETEEKMIDVFQKNKSWRT